MSILDSTLHLISCYILPLLPSILLLIFRIYEFNYILFQKKKTFRRILLLLHYVTLLSVVFIFQPLLAFFIIYALTFLLKSYLDWSPHISKLDKGDWRPVCLVTGGNSGIGYGIVKELVGAGYEVAVLCRNPDKCQRVCDELNAKDPQGWARPFVLDLSDFESIDSCAAELLNTYRKIHYIYLNAGLLTLEPNLSTKQGFEIHLGVMHFGHLRLLLAIQDLIDESHVVSITSGTWALGKLKDEGGVLAEVGPVSDVKESVPMVATTYTRAKKAIVVSTMMLQNIFTEKALILLADPGEVKSQLTNKLLNRFIPIPWLANVIEIGLFGTFFRNENQAARIILNGSMKPNLRGGIILNSLGGENEVDNSFWMVKIDPEGMDMETYVNDVWAASIKHSLHGLEELQTKLMPTL